MYLVSESVAASLVTMTDAIDAVAAAFAAFDGQRAAAFPVVMGQAGGGDVVGLKGGVIAGTGETTGLVGAKVGSYWPGNRARDMPAHGSTTLLLDPDTGFPRALVAASALNALRTAASGGVAIRALARPDASTLALVGAGNQAWFEVQAAMAVRPIARVRITNRTPAAAAALARRIRDELGLEAEPTDPRTAVSGADIVATVTAATAPLLEAGWIAPGTHISAMGADADGKQELPVELVAGAACFADIVDQSMTVGEFRSACRAGRLSADAITPIGAVLTGRARGRPDAGAITIYDSSGTALQDLAIADLALRRAIARGLAVHADGFHPVP